MFSYQLLSYPNQQIIWHQYIRSSLKVTFGPCVLTNRLSIIRLWDSLKEDKYLKMPILKVLNFLFPIQLSSLWTNLFLATGCYVTSNTNDHRQITHYFLLSYCPNSQRYKEHKHKWYSFLHLLLLLIMNICLVDNTSGQERPCPSTPCRGTMPLPNHMLGYHTEQPIISFFFF